MKFPISTTQAKGPLGIILADVAELIELQPSRNELVAVAVAKQARQANRLGLLSNNILVR